MSLAEALGEKHPDRLGRQLALLYDGASIGASMERDPAIVKDAREAAEALLPPPAVPAKSKGGVQSPRKRVRS